MSMDNGFRDIFCRETAIAGIILIVLIAAILFAAPLFTGGKSTERVTPPSERVMQGLPVRQPVHPPVTVLTNGPVVTLPAPDHQTNSSLDYALEHRGSTRAYMNDSISLSNLSLILWSAQGITDPVSGKRTAPTTMHSYPLTLYVAVSNVSELNPGVYIFLPKTHALSQYLNTTGRDQILSALGRRQVMSAPVTIIVSGNFNAFKERMSSSDDVPRYISLEAGHVVQNILLMETSRGMAGVPFTDFNATAVDVQLSLNGNNHVVYAVTAGYPADL